MKKTTVFLLVLILCLLVCGCAKEECAHQFAATVNKEATCKETGSQTLTCKNCGVSFTLETPANALHVYSETVTKEATCAEEGILTRACTLCGKKEETPLPLGEHRFDFDSLNPSVCILCGTEVEGGGVDTENPWYGKKWVAVGTSLTSAQEGKFVEPLARRSGMEVTNLGVPGGTAGKEVLESVKNSDAFAGADLVTIEFGVNDWFAGIPLGIITDTNPYVTTEEGESGSFAGACYQIFKAVQEKAPNALVVFLTQPTGRNSMETGESCIREKPNFAGLYQINYIDTAMAVARYMGIPIIDAGSRSMINQEHAQYLKDQIHHTELGGKQYARTIWTELKDMQPLLKAE